MKWPNVIEVFLELASKKLIMNLSHTEFWKLNIDWSVYLGTWTHHGAYVEFRGQLPRVTSLLLPCVSWESVSGCYIDRMQHDLLRHLGSLQWLLSLTSVSPKTLNNVYWWCYEFYVMNLFETIIFNLHLFYVWVFWLHLSVQHMCVLYPGKPK